ncbi:MAG TPA: FAD-dependent oxidoreductase, partial [Bacillota bacterium]|nr:FAD-dependent oxidoreductase [Bacillota bacterium]
MSLRYVINFDTSKIESEIWDVVVIGSGIAGLYSAFNLDSNLKICILSKGALDKNNSYLAQGGIAAAMGEDDMPEYHFKDTVKAGAGHCNEEAVDILVREAPKDIEILCRIGTNFDRNPEGMLVTTREGGHGCFRVIHAHGDATGKEVVDSLLRACRNKENITIKENCFAIDMLVAEGRCAGLLIAEGTDFESTKKVLYCRSIICASGGIG